MKKFKLTAAALAAAGVLAVTGTAPSFVPAPASTAKAADDYNDDWLHAVGSGQRVFHLGFPDVFAEGVAADQEGVLPFGEFRLLQHVGHFLFPALTGSD